MDAAKLRQILADLGITQVILARLLGVTPRAVNLWIAGERDVPRPVEAYLRLLVSLPKAIQAQEFDRLNKEATQMLDGMYAINFVGKSGQGNGVIILTGGLVFGSDGGVQYDGTYEPSSTQPGKVDVHLKLTVPPGVWLVQGVPAQPVEYRFDIDCTFAPGTTSTVKIQTPFGPIQVKIEFLRAIPKELAA